MVKAAALSMLWDSIALATSTEEVVYQDIRCSDHAIMNRGKKQRRLHFAHVPLSGIPPFDQGPHLASGRTYRPSSLHTSHPYLPTFYLSTPLPFHPCLPCTSPHLPLPPLPLLALSYCFFPFLPFFSCPNLHAPFLLRTSSTFHQLPFPMDRPLVCAAPPSHTPIAPFTDTFPSPVLL